MDGLATIATKRKGLILSRRHVLSAREQGIRHLDSDCRIQTILEDLEWPLGPLSELTNVYVNGVLITPEYYQTAIVTPEDYIAVVLVPKGGGGSSGKKSGKAILQVVALIGMRFIPGLGQALTASLLGESLLSGSISGTAFTVAQNAITAGLGIVAALAMGALFGPRFKDSGADSVERSYTVGGSSNQATPYNSVIRLYGRHLMAPRIAALPYNTSNGIDQFSTMILDFGYGDIQVEDLKVGSTAVSSISGFQYIIHKNVQGDSPALQYYRADVNQQNEQLELRSPTLHVLTSAANTDQIEIDLGFPEGLYSKDAKFGFQSASHDRLVRINISFRERGQTAWVPWRNVATLINSPAAIYFPYTTNQAVEFTGINRRGFTSTFAFKFPKTTTWEMLIQKTSPNWDSENQSSTWSPFASVSLTAIRSFFPGIRPIKPRTKHTMMEVYARASEQISGALQEISAIGTSVLRVWNGSGFEWKPTRNPAWIYADVLTGEANPRPVSDDKIDWGNLLYWANFCDQPRNGEPLYHYDAVHDSSTTVWDQLQLVATAGRASPTRRDGKYGVIIDTEQTVPVQMFTMLNSADHSVSKTFLDLPHALRVKFVDPGLEWKVNEILVFDDGYNESNATKFEELQLRGVTRYNQAWRDARHWFAAAKLRREELSFKTDVENLVCQRGDLILWQSDVNIVGGMAARIDGVNGSRITVDAPAGVLSGSLGIRIRNASGISKVLSATQTDEYSFTINEAFSAQIGDLIVYGKTQTVTGEYLVKEIAAGPNLSAEIVACEVGRGIYQADQGAIPPYVPQGGGISQTVGPPVTNFYGSCNNYFVDRYPHADIQLGWSLPANVIAPLKYNIYQLQEGEFGSIGQSSEISYLPYEGIDLFGSEFYDGQVLRFAVEPVWSNVTGPKVETTVVIRVPAPQPTPAPTGLKASWVGPGISVEWADPRDPLVVKYKATLKQNGSMLAVKELQALSTLFEDTLVGDYAVEVIAIDWRGTSSPVSVIQVNVPLITAPQNFRFTLSEAGIHLAWDTVTWYGSAEYILRESGNADRRYAGSAATLNPRRSGNYALTLFAIDRLGQESVASQLTVVVPVVTAPTNIASNWTPDGIVITWTGSTSLWVTGHIFEEDARPDVLVSGSRLVIPVRVAGSYTFRLRAVNSVGEKSVAVAVSVVVPSVPAVQNVRATVRPEGVELLWAKVEGFNVTGYVLRRVSGGVEEPSGEIFVQADTFFLPPHAADQHSYAVRARDALGQESTSFTAAPFTILLPKGTRVSGNAVANTAFLRWGSLSGAEGWSAQTSHAIEFYELSRLRLTDDASRWSRLGFSSAQQMLSVRTAQAMYATNYRVMRGGGAYEKFATEFTYIDETQPGRWKYGVRAVDVAGNRGPFEYLELNLNAPDNYELLDRLDNWLPVASTMSNLLERDGLWLAPINPNQTYRQHFVNNGNASPAQQIARGWPYYLQPGEASAFARWTHDFGIDMPPLTLRSMAYQIPVVDPATIVTRLYYRLAGSADWVLGVEGGPETTLVMQNPTREVAIEVELLNNAERTAFSKLERVEYWLEVRYVTDQGIADVPSSGTPVQFSKIYMDVRNVQLTLQNVGDAAFVRYTIAQDQQSMTLYCFNSSGLPTAGRVSWTVKGV